MSLAGFDLVRLLERVYAVDATDIEWLSGIVEALRLGMETGLGMAAYTYDASTRPLAVRELILDCPLSPGELGKLMDQSSDQYIAGAWLSKSVATASETEGYEKHPGVASVFHPVGIRDVFVLNALDPLGIGCLVGAPLPKLRTISDYERETWQHIVAHIRTAQRLRSRIAACAEPAVTGADSGAVEAVVRRDGRIEHAETIAQNSLSELSIATSDMEHARRTHRGKRREALAHWKPLVSERWTLVYEMESQGERYVLARANRPSVRGPDTLSPRERQILNLLVLGHGYKVIAYELGISHSTVRVLAGRCRSKFGASNLADLVEKYRRTIE